MTDVPATDGADGARAAGGAADGPPTDGPAKDKPASGGQVPALEVTGLSRRFGGLFAVRDVSLSIPAGARFGIIGPNGAGKTTLFNVLSGELRPTSGTIRMHGRDITRLPVPKRTALGLGRTFQITRLFNELTVRENLTLAVHGLSKTKLQMMRPWRSYRKEQRRAEDLAASFGLGNSLNRRPQELSHGELRELEVLLALASDPSVLLLDEPAAGLSPAERVDILNLMTRLPASLTLVIIEHDMNVLREAADWLAVLHYGQIVTQGPIAEVQRHGAVRELYLGSSAETPEAPSETSEAPSEKASAQAADTRGKSEQ